MNLPLMGGPGARLAAPRAAAPAAPNAQTSVSPAYQMTQYPTGGLGQQYYGGYGGGVAAPAPGNTLNPAFSNYNVSPAAAISAFNAGMAPAQWTANRNAMQAAAAGGLAGGPLDQVVADANAQFLAAMDPTIASLIQNAQSMGLGQSEFNANATNTANQNQAYLNQTGSQNNANSIWALLGGLGSAFA